MMCFSNELLGCPSTRNKSLNKTHQKSFYSDSIVVCSHGYRHRIQLAIAIAQEGGIGIIHKNFSVDDQASQVNRVKKFASGIISDPVTVCSDITIREVLEITKFNNISGVPVVDDGITDRHCDQS